MVSLSNWVAERQAIRRRLEPVKEQIRDGLGRGHAETLRSGRVLTGNPNRPFRGLRSLGRIARRTSPVHSVVPRRGGVTESRHDSMPGTRRLQPETVIAARRVSCTLAFMSARRVRLKLCAIDSELY